MHNGTASLSCSWPPHSASFARLDHLVNDGVGCSAVFSDSSWDTPTKGRFIVDWAQIFVKAFLEIFCAAFRQVPHMLWGGIKETGCLYLKCLGPPVPASSDCLPRATPPPQPGLLCVGHHDPAIWSPRFKNFPGIDDPIPFKPPLDAVHLQHLQLFPIGQVL